MAGGFDAGYELEEAWRGGEGGGDDADGACGWEAEELSGVEVDGGGGGQLAERIGEGFDVVVGDLAEEFEGEVEVFGACPAGAGSEGFEGVLEFEQVLAEGVGELDGKEESHGGLSEGDGLLELVEAEFDVGFGDALEAGEGEIGDGEAGDDGAEGQGASEGGRGGVVFGGEVAHHATGEGIACAGWVDDLIGGESREDEEVGGGAEEAAVLAFFDDDELGAHFEDGISGGDEVFVVGEQASFAVVEDEAMDSFEEVSQLSAFVVDPEVHGVGDDECGGGQVVDHALLEEGVGIGKEDMGGIAEGFGDGGCVFGEDVEVDLDGGGFVEVFEVGAMPAEGFGAFSDFEACGIDGTGVEDGEVLWGAVVADGADEADGGEEGGGIGEVDSGAADDVIAFSGGSFDGIDADRTCDEQ